VRTFKTWTDAADIAAAHQAMAWCFDRRPLEFMRKEIDAIELALRELQVA
jgi:hypothetical protein